ncbi:MAG: cupin domain-containing protein [Elusimicrobiota bacterium]
MKLIPKLIALDKIKKYQRLLKQKMGSLKIHSGHVVLKKGENIGEHLTDGVEEMLIILDGKASVIIDRKKVIKAKMNSVVYVPPNTLHDVKNISSKILRYIYITSPTN